MGIDEMNETTVRYYSTSCCPLCSKMEELYLHKPSYDYDEETENCEVIEDELD